jgi:hypothetical protein|tara:strand:+ start:1019 stop:1273 length:255 start_codon:yes stop_codon:yes gene_type:complete
MIEDINKKILEESIGQLELLKNRDEDDTVSISQSDIEKLIEIINEQTFENEDQIKKLYLSAHNKAKETIENLVNEIIDRERGGE